MAIGGVLVLVLLERVTATPRHAEAEIPPSRRCQPTLPPHNRC
jgi:hypothetical protein